MDVPSPGRTSPVVTVFTSVALRGVLEELEPALRAATGCSLAMTFGPGNPMLASLRAGTVDDVLISRSQELDMAVAEGFCGSVLEIGTSAVALAVRAGVRHPVIVTSDDVTRALLGARHVAFTDPATGAASSVHLMKVLTERGIAEQVAASARLGWGNPVAEFLVSGDADLAVQHTCELLLVDNVEVVGPLPDELQLVTTMAVAVHRRAVRPDAAADLVARLTSPDVQAGLSRHGLQSITPRPLRPYLVGAHTEATRSSDPSGRQTRQAARPLPPAD